MFTDIEQPKRVTWTLLQREQELGQLNRFIDNVERQAPARQVVLTGGPGSGRTAVLRELGRRNASRGRFIGMSRVTPQITIAAALVEAFDEAIGSMISKRPGAPVLSRMQSALRTFASVTLVDGLQAATLAAAIDQLLPAMMFDTNEIPQGYVLSIDDAHLADPSHVGAVLEGLVTMAITGAPLAVVISAADSLDVESLVGEPSDLEIVTLRAFDHAAVRSIVTSSGVNFFEGGIQHLESVTGGRANDVFALLSELSLRAGSLGPADIDEVRSTLLREANNRAAVASAAVEPGWRAPWDTDRRTDDSLMVPVDAQMMAAALEEFAPPSESVDESVETPLATVSMLPSVAREFPVVDKSHLDPELDDDSLLDTSDLDDVVLDEPALFDSQSFDALDGDPVPALTMVSRTTPPKISDPSQRRILRTVADMREKGLEISIDTVRRKVGDLNRFTGVSPVVVAVDQLSEMGLIIKHADGSLELTAVGIDAVLASA